MAEKRTAVAAEEEEDPCPICYDGPSPPFGELKCGHSYCYKCINAWSKKSNLCPMCKRRYTRLRKISVTGKLLSSRHVRRQDFQDYDQDIDSEDYVSDEDDDEYKTCRICGAGDDLPMLFYCDYPGCSNMQHSYCCLPCVDKPPEDGEFFCSDCVREHKLPSHWTTEDKTINPTGYRGLGATTAVAAAVGDDADAGAAAAPRVGAADDGDEQEAAALFPSSSVLPDTLGSGEGGSQASASTPAREIEIPAAWHLPAMQPLGGGPAYRGLVVPPPLEEGEVRELPRNPHAQDGLMHLIHQPADRKVAVVEDKNTRHKYDTMATLHEGFHRSMSSLRRPAPRRAARPRSAPPQLDPVSGSRDVVDIGATRTRTQQQPSGGSSTSQPPPRRQLSLSESARLFRSRSAASQEAPTQQEEADPAPEKLNQASLQLMQNMLQQLRLEMRNERGPATTRALSAPPKRVKQEKPRRSRAQIYAARAALAVALIAAAAGKADADAARERRRQRREAAAAAPQSLLHGVYVTSAAKNVVIKSVKELLLPAYQCGRLGREQFKQLAQGIVDSYLNDVVMRNREMLAKSRNPTQRLVNILLTPTEHRRLEHLCLDRVNT